ncbi:3'-5' exonuclease [Paracoccus sp. Z330]|uniref:DNA-directed DNA polymerase n=1 Tax=Paracoccus onchidii TaxID=3017813 RepID=A0ABT4ZC88_9RHOB|nr:3'-5' exonuclease [Paracoccus onchidii]MDB6176969.1 3'-5' exonuclease [Paracoccus onchidii]
MTLRDRSLRLRILLLFVGLGGLVLTILGAALGVAALRLGNADLRSGVIVDAFALAGLIAGLGAVGAIAAVWLLFDRHVARPIETLAGGLRTGQAPSAEDSRYLADLGPAVQDAARARASAAQALAKAVRDHAGELAHEKETLEKILADFGAGAVMTDAHHRIVFYNGAAAALLNGIALDRLLDRYIVSGAIDAAQARLATGVEATDLVCRTIDGSRLTGRMRQVDEKILLILRDEDAVPALPRDRLETLRRHAATLVPMLDALDGPMPADLAEAIRHEGRGLARETRALSELISGRGSVGRANLAELTAGLQLKAKLPDVVVLADAGPLNALLRRLQLYLRDDGLDPVLDCVMDDPTEAHLSLVWTGRPVAMSRLEDWLAQPPDCAQPDLCGAEILAAHATGIWPETLQGGQARLVLPLAVATGAQRPTGLTYDFALGRRGPQSSRLSELTCVVFDTETTGLDVSDRIVQIAGLRIAGGRLTGESFETLVNPHRAIPPAATRIHRISDDMVADAPDIGAALSAFHHFAEDAVLVAHNAPFDMGLLHAAQSETGVHFANPVLDTVLLSAMVWGYSADHSLDALASRLEIDIPSETRHSAMGDSIATARVFLRLVAALEAKGIQSFQDVTENARKFRRLIADANHARQDSIKGG